MLVENVDFGKHRDLLVGRHGQDPAVVDEGFRHVRILLAAAQRRPDRAYALTKAGDVALHALVGDTMGLIDLSRRLFGEGRILAHNPFAWGTAEFAVAWENTRSAFAEAGISLRPLADGGEGEWPFDPEGCFFEVERIAA